MLLCMTVECFLIDNTSTAAQLDGPHQKTVPIYRRNTNNGPIPVAVWSNALSPQPVDCWNRRFEFRWGHGYSWHSFLVCCAGSGVCDKLITRPEESYEVCVCVCLSVCQCVCVWSWNLNNQAVWAPAGLLRHSKKYVNLPECFIRVFVNRLTTPSLTHIMQSSLHDCQEAY